MRLIPASHRRIERLLWFGASTLLILTALFMIGLRE